ncbi:MAG: trigger factor [Alphaproteobacteria bacterium]|nr:MAG: trigger factor [Alphaproteobacteria bacterium]
MQIKQTKDNALEKEFTVTMTAEEIAQRVDEKLQEIGQTMKIPGFRQGKVPLAVLKSRYGQSVLGEVLESAVNDSSMKAINENKIKPAMQPKIEVESFEEGKGLKYTMTVEVLPEIKLTDLKKLKLERHTAKPEKKTIDEALERIAKGNKVLEDVTEKRAAKKGDTVVIDFDGTVDGEARPGMKGDGYALELGSGSFVDTFEDQLVGCKAGDKKTVTVTFPKNYGSEELAGKEAEFAVTVQKLQKAVLPKTDDEFAKKLGFDDLKALKTAVTEQIQADYDRLTRLHTKRQLLDILDDTHKFDVPAGMLDSEYESILHHLAHQDGSHHHGEECNHEVDLSDSEKKEYREIAERRVKLGLVLAEIGRENKVEVSQGELQQAVINEARRYPGQEKQVFDYYQNTPQALEALRAPLYEEKIVDFILEICSVINTSISFDELLKLAEEAEQPIKEKKKASAKGKAKSSKTSDATKKASTKKKDAASKTEKSGKKADSKKK